MGFWFMGVILSFVFLILSPNACTLENFKLKATERERGLEHYLFARTKYKAFVFG